MKLLLAGASWQHEMYESACARALEKLGVKVIPFYLGTESRNFLSRFEFKYAVRGPYLRHLQEKLLARIEDTRPDVVLIWLGACVFPETLQAIKRSGRIILASYIHDDPFAHRVHRISPKHHRFYWRHFIEALPIYNLSLFSKQQNVEEALKLGAPHAGVLRQYFVPELHRLIHLTSTQTERYGCDVAFAGHFEPDGRKECIGTLAQAGFRVRIYGDESWKHAAVRDFPKSLQLFPRVRGEEYVMALAGARMCLCFMSKMNRDQYTTRCFEIPACGRLLLSERTADLQRMFKEDEEAVFFSSPKELATKARWLLDNPNVIERIAQAGMRRVHADRHSVDDRMEDFVTMVNKTNG